MKEKLEHPDPKILLKATRDGDAHLVQLYLDNQAISQENRGRAVRLAAENGHATVISLLDGRVSDSP